MIKTLKKTIKKLFRTNRRILVEKDLKKINLKKYKKVLVVGSGKDPYRNLFSEDIEEYIRFDIEPHDGLTDVIGDIHEAPFDDNSFDCIFAIEVMEHLENPFLFKKEIHQVMYIWKQNYTFILIAFSFLCKFATFCFITSICP